MRWWRRQRIPLLALAGAIALVIGVNVWLEVLPHIKEPKATPVADGAVSLGGNTLELGRVTPDEFAAPAGTRPLSIRLYASSEADAEYCGTFTLREATGERVWRPAGREVDVERGDAESSCREGMDAYDILTVFLLPADADGPFWLDVPVDGEVARFRIDG